MTNESVSKLSVCLSVPQLKVNFLSEGDVPEPIFSQKIYNPRIAIAILFMFI